MEREHMSESRNAPERKSPIRKGDEKLLNPIAFWIEDVRERRNMSIREVGDVIELAGIGPYRGRRASETSLYTIQKVLEGAPKT